MFFSVTLAKIHGVTDFWGFINNRNPIEEFFGKLHSMHWGDSETLDLRK
jgi:hypothetical protein